MDTPCVALTDEFNRGRLRALLSSGQAVVMHRLAVASKDGDWILREGAEATGHVLREIAALPLVAAHEVVCARAAGLLPLTVEGATP